MWEIRWADYGSTEFEQCCAIRFEVFVNEQSVPPELELDEADKTARHGLLWVDGQPAATARLLLNTPSAQHAKIGRVATLAPFRGQGLASRLMQFLEEEAVKQGQVQVTLDAQVGVLGLYEKLGYVAFGPVFDDAGIDHRKMSKSLRP